MSNTNQLSRDQVAILTKFIRAKSLRYSDGRPGRMSNDNYKYHLKYLVQKGYVKKIGKDYELTNKGKLFGFEIDAKGKNQEKFWVHVHCFVERQKGTRREVLVQKKVKHPYFGDVYVISGKILPGEKIEEAAQRKFKEETGLTCQFRFVGTIRRAHKNVEGEIVQDAFFQVCYGANPKGKLVTKNVFGENFWAPYRQVLDLHQRNLTNGKHDLEIIKRLKKHNFEQFYFHDETTLARV